MSDSRGKPSKPVTTPPERRRLTAAPERRRLAAASATPPAGSTALAPRLPTALAQVAEKKRSNIHDFDKAFQVLVSSSRGVMNGVGRNISTEGMFIETREPLSIGSVVRITFLAPSLETELTAVAEVRFQTFLNFAGPGGEQEGLRGMGVRFVRFEEDATRPARGDAQ